MYFPLYFIHSSSENKCLYELCLCTYKLLYLFLDNHVIIQFLDEDSTAIVPIRRLKEQERGAHVLLITVVLNSRDRKGKLWLPQFHTSNNQLKTDFC